MLNNKLPKKIQKFLEKSEVKFEILSHKKVFTALDKAATLKVKARTVGKTIVVKFDSSYGLVLIPAHRRVNLQKLRTAINKERRKEGLKPVKKVKIVPEKWIKQNLKGVKEGAVPPFGTLWKLPTFVEKALMREKHIILHAGHHRLSIRLKPKDLLKLLPGIAVNILSDVVLGALL